MSTKKLIQGVLVLSGIYTVFPFLYVAKYDHPSADDYTYAVGFSQHGLWYVVKEDYLHWSGRYLSRIIWWFCPANDHSLTHYRLFPMIMILLFAAAIIILVNTIVKDYLSLPQTLGLSCLLIFLYLSRTPSTSEAFYWYSSASIYQTANILTLLLLAALIKLHRSNKPAAGKAAANTILCSLLCIAIIGCNEVSLIITVLFIYFFTVSQYVQTRKRNPKLIALCAVCLVSALAEVCAPGNFQRLGAEGSRSIVWTIAGSLSITAVYVSEWIGPLLAVSVLYVPLFGLSIAQKQKAAQTNEPIPLKRFIGFFVATFCFLQVFVIWVAGGSNLGRVFDVIYLFFILSYFFILQLALNANIHRLTKLIRHAPKFSLLGLMFYLAALFDINNNVSTAYVDILSGKGKQYDEQLATRLTTAKQCKTDTCHVPALSAIPSTIFFTDIRPLSDPDGLWINKYYSAYFNIPLVVPDTPPPVATPNIESLRNIGRTMRSRMIK